MIAIFKINEARKVLAKMARMSAQRPWWKTETFGVWVTGTVLITLAVIQILWPPDPTHPMGPRFLSFLAGLTPWFRLLVTVVLPVFTAILGYRFAIQRTLREGPSSPPSSKLTIHSADYRAIYGGGDFYDVTECLKQMVIGDGLAFDIENHNFVAGGRNCVPKDPKNGVRKRLRVEYSFDNSEKHVIERFERRRLVLPEEEFGLFSAVQSEAMSLSNRIRDFVKEIGPRPDADWNSADKSDPDWIAKKIGERRALVSPWLSRLTHRYTQEFLPDIHELVHYLGGAGLNTQDLGCLIGQIQTEFDLSKVADALDSSAIELGRLPAPFDQDKDTIAKYESLSLDKMKRLLQNYPDAGKLVDEAIARKGTEKAT